MPLCGRSYIYPASSSRATLSHSSMSRDFLLQFVCLLTLMQGNRDIVEHSYDNAVKMWYYIHGFSVNVIVFTVPSMIRIFTLVCWQIRPLREPFSMLHDINRTL
jgi:hypothetical protein